MKAIYCSLIVAVFSISTSFAQADDPKAVRQRIVGTEEPTKLAAVPAPKQAAPAPKPLPAVEKTVDNETFREVKTGRMMSFGQIKSKIAEAKRDLQTKPLATAAVTLPDGRSAEYVRIAFHDWKKNDIDFLVLSKEQLLSVDEEEVLSSESGTNLRIRTIRGNGVNTPVVLTDMNGEKHQPLMVQYPVIRGGKFIEMAYYMSTHPGLVTPEVVNAGRLYVKNVIDIARDRLREKGVVIQPKLADIAERLAAVEHVDHARFRTEQHKLIFDDIYTLFALNEGQTYRYSVSSAGAGGMVQMIPATYRMVRGWHPNVPLMPDFVTGMQNHVNATQAMLLYMQRTWNDLNSSQTIRSAVANGLATQEQLMAAGYNSNPARLAGYINRGGSGWTNLIPRETKIYLSIYESIERQVPMAPRSR
jgi:hypothetical protein